MVIPVRHIRYLIDFHHRTRIAEIYVAKKTYISSYETLHRPFKLIRMIQSLHPFYGTIEGKRIPDALNHFIEVYHVNLLAMLPHKHSLLERWFIKSAAHSRSLKPRFRCSCCPNGK
jgi:hypothetical protein